MARNPTVKQETRTEARRRIVSANLMAGVPYRDIARKLALEGHACSLGIIARDKKMLVERWKKESGNDIRAHVELDLLRINQLINSLWKLANSDPPDKGAVAECRKLMERKAKMLGLDSPELLNVGLSDGFEVKGVNFIDPSNDPDPT